MDKDIARSISHQYDLIPGKTGRRILLAIKNNTPIDNAELPSGVTLEHIEHLKALYQQKAQQLNTAQSPRNLIFYQLIKEKFPAFTWGETEQGGIVAARVKKLRPSLLSLLLNKVHQDNDNYLYQHYQCVDQLPTLVLKTISALMNDIEVIYPDEYTMALIVTWILKGLKGETLSIFSPICPDYSVEPTGNPECPYRHTFNELGEGNGLIAQRILSVLPVVVKTLISLNIDVNVTIGFGDFEAYSDANLQRLSLTQNEFLQRVNKSKNAFEKACIVSADVQLITDMFGGYPAWLKQYNAMETQLKEKQFGVSLLTEEKLLTIVGKRKNLYDRWYGNKPILEHVPQLLMQGAEYAVLGKVISTKLKNCLVFGADNDAMGLFYSVANTLPTLYLERFYC